MNGERARLFVALELPGEARDALVEWRASVLGPSEPLRLVARGDLHVTLCFLGWCDWAQAGAIARACEAVRGTAAPALALAEPVALPPRRPRVLAVSLEDLGGSLGSLQATTAAALHAGGW